MTKQKKERIKQMAEERKDLLKELKKAKGNFSKTTEIKSQLSLLDKELWEYIDVQF